MILLVEGVYLEKYDCGFNFWDTILSPFLWVVELYEDWWGIGGYAFRICLYSIEFGIGMQNKPGYLTSKLDSFWCNYISEHMAWFWSDFMHFELNPKKYSKIVVVGDIYRYTLILLRLKNSFLFLLVFLCWWNWLRLLWDGYL